MTKQDLQFHLSLARHMVEFMDNKFSFLGLKFGLDPILDIIPGFGNVMGVAISCYLFWIARELSVPKSLYFQMAKNIGVDFLLGSVPVAGVIFDLLFKANVKNLAILEPYLQGHVIKGEYVES